MIRKILPFASAALSAMVIASIAVSGVAAHDRRASNGTLGAAALATARFQEIRVAKRAGYALPDAPAPLHECISSLDQTGAMGFHYINGALLDDKPDARHPEALVYAPDRHGRLHLVALEYVIFQSAWFEHHPAGSRPTLFGQAFMDTPDDNRYQIPAFFSLHVWLWKANPSGLFAPFNPNVSCDPTSDHRHRGRGDGRGDTDRHPGLKDAAATFRCGIPGTAASHT